MSSVKPQFPLFPNLPYDLRYKIWEDALQFLPPRLLNLNYLYIRRPSFPVPILLHTTRESRSIALRRYKLWKMFNSRLPYPGRDTSFYVSFNRDIFILDHLAIRGHSSCYPDLTIPRDRRARHTEGVGHQIQHVAIDIEDWIRALKLLSETGKKGEPLLLLDQFTGLEALDVSLGRPSQLWQTRGWELEEIEEGTGGFTVDFEKGKIRTAESLSAGEALKMMRDARPGWKIPAVRLVTAYNRF